MKKLYSFILFTAAGFFCSVSAQQIAPALKGNPVAKKSGTPSPMVVDTLWGPSSGMPCDTVYYYYQWDATGPIDTGYAFGNDKFGSVEVAQKYNYTGVVKEVIVSTSYLKGTAGTTTAKIYDVNATNKQPLNVIGTSTTTLTTGTMSTSLWNVYGFATPVSVNGNFAASIVLPNPAAGDTVAVTATNLQCAGTDSLSWIKYSTAWGWLSTFNALAKVYGYPYSVLVSLNYNVDVLVLPVVDNQLGVNELASSKGLTLKGAYPNPATSFTAIRFETQSASDVSLQVFDLSGKVIEAKTEKLSAGNHEWKVSLENVAEGNYYYTIKTGEAQLTSKFVVTK